jgi:signal transduction histidine kinase
MPKKESRTNLIPTFLAVTIAIIISTSLQYNYKRSQLIQALQENGEMAAAAATVSLAQNGGLNLWDSLNAFEKSKAVSGLCLYDNKGHFLSGFSSDIREKCPEQKQEISNLENILLFTYPLRLVDKSYGELHAFLSNRTLSQILTNDIIIASVLIFFSISLLLAWEKFFYKRQKKKAHKSLVSMHEESIFNESKSQSQALINAFEKMSYTIEHRDRSLKYAKKKAESANRAKSEFLFNMSHELRTPMHAILNFAEMGANKLNDGPKDKILQYFRHIEQSSERLLRIIDELLDLAKMEAGRSEFSFRSENIDQCVTKIIAELQPALEKKQINLSLNQSIRDREVWCDTGRIMQVLVNLLANAIRHTEANGKIQISIDPAKIEWKEGNAANAVAVSVFNEGQTISPEQQEKIFLKFEQGNTNSPGATGLGLAICKTIIEAHKGKIWVENIADKGIKFIFTLPQQAIIDSDTETQKINSEQPA